MQNIMVKGISPFFLSKTAGLFSERIPYQKVSLEVNVFRMKTRIAFIVSPLVIDFIEGCIFMLYYASFIDNYRRTFWL